MILFIHGVPDTPALWTPLIAALDLKPGIAEWSKRAYSELQALLWDVKFQVGAAHRNLPELERLIEGGLGGIETHTWNAATRPEP